MSTDLLVKKGDLAPSVVRELLSAADRFRRSSTNPEVLKKEVWEELEGTLRKLNVISKDGLDKLSKMVNEWNPPTSLGNRSVAICLERIAFHPELIESSVMIPRHGLQSLPVQLLSFSIYRYLGCSSGAALARCAKSFAAPFREYVNTLEVASCKQLMRCKGDKKDLKAVFPKLRVISGEQSRHLFGKNLKIFCETFPGLEKLTLGEANQTSSALSDPDMTTLGTHCQNLTFLELINAHYLTTTGMKQLAAGCTKLTHLKLSLLSIENEALEAFALHCPRLEHVELENCREYDNDGVVALTKLGLSYLNLSTNNVMKNTALFALGNCRQLRGFLISSNGHITDDGVEALVKGCQLLSTLVLDRCQKLTDKTLVALSENLKLLTRFSAEHNSKFTENGFLPFIMGCGKTLRSLNLSNCVNLNDDMLIAVARYCPNLEELNVSGNPLITARGLAPVMQKCRRLSDLDVSNCKGVKDDALIGIAPYCARLSRIHLAATFITDKGFTHLLSHSRNLSFANIGLTLISIDMLQTCKDNFPHITIQMPAIVIKKSSQFSLATL